MLYVMECHCVADQCRIVFIYSIQFPVGNMTELEVARSHLVYTG